MRLVTIENIHQGKHLSGAPSIRNINLGAIELIERLFERGRAAGAFRADLDALDVRMVISAL